MRFLAVPLDVEHHVWIGPVECHDFTVRKGHEELANEADGIDGVEVHREHLEVTVRRSARGT